MKFTVLFVKGAKLQFESNSQLVGQADVLGVACLWRVQSYNLKAIHNAWNFGTRDGQPVCEGCKVTIWKQFTTIQCRYFLLGRLFVKGAKLQFESNSQRASPKGKLCTSCLWRVQSYNLKAIHNPQKEGQFIHIPVCEGCKVTIWKQFTTMP